MNRLVRKLKIFLIEYTTKLPFSQEEKSNPSSIVFFAIYWDKNVTYTIPYSENKTIFFS